MVRFACLVGLCVIAFAALSPTGVALAGVATTDCPAAGCDDFVSVPEPSSLVLLATGLGALGWVLRRRR